MSRRILPAALFIWWLVAAVILLAGCGPKEGLVLDKRWKPDLSYWGTRDVCSYTGNRPYCSTYPHWYSMPAEWILILKTPEGDVKDKYVSQTKYYTINVGDYYKED